MRWDEALREKVRVLRGEGKTFFEIGNILKIPVPKSTLSDWCKSVPLSQDLINRIELKIREGHTRARAIALTTIRKRREAYLRDLDLGNQSLRDQLKNPEVAKILLATLYLAEGTKGSNGSVRFGNSDPMIISLFLTLFRSLYSIDEKKFRGTVLCRADQNIDNLDRYWSKLTGIPRSQFYRARIDNRTVGKITKKKEYKGAFVIYYFSAHAYHDLRSLGKILCAR